METGDVERFEAAVGGLLDELGYPRACARVSPAARERVKRLREQFLQALAQRRNAIANGAVNR
jgi:hypothetical protein